MGREAAFSPSAALARKLDILPAEERRAIEHEAAELAGGFMASPRAAQAREAFRRAREEGPGGSAVFAIEYPFVYRSAGPRGPVFLSGAMDLVYGDEFGVCVLDFKTDRCIAPERHAFQLGVYREAAGELFCRPARAFLYYLRHGTEVEASALPEEGLLHEALARDMGDGADIA